jgi:hypothetical protein
MAMTSNRNLEKERQEHKQEIKFAQETIRLEEAKVQKELQSQIILHL